MNIRPHDGPQTNFLSCEADIAIFGGSAGGGKTWALLLEALRHATDNPKFSAVYFRRTTTQIKNPGGLWDQAMKLYPLVGGIPSYTLEWRWREGGKVKFAHLEHEASKLDWHGAELPLILWDELTTFTSSQFWYLMSRNRSMSGVKGYIRASCNPDADSWVAELIAWWINQDTGIPIPERSGVIRWFVRNNDLLDWGDSFAEMQVRFPDSIPKSLTFIGATLADNTSLEAADPGYRANLMSLQLVERERLLGGNWKIRPSAGLYFQRGWCALVDVPPAGMRVRRGWDLAATAYTGSNNPDWTCCVKMGRTIAGRYVVLDARWMRGNPGEVRRFVLNTSSEDGKQIGISMEQEPGGSGKEQAQRYVADLAGYMVRCTVSSGSGDKITRFSPFSAQAEAGNVSILRGGWNERFLSELEAFPEAAHDDLADATATVFKGLTTGAVTIGIGFVEFGSREQIGWAVPPG